MICVDISPVPPDHVTRVGAAGGGQETGARSRSMCPRSLGLNRANLKTAAHFYLPFTVEEESASSGFSLGLGR